jgi:hypothetical protein
VKVGQRVKLMAITPDLLASGLRIGQVGIVKEVPGQESNVLGVEFEGYSETGWNAGLHVVSVNTRRDGQTIPVISLCEVADR